ncbi:hypothetical protein [Truepera radiovictrix]|uniref:hypothetical protein n=1 Tax=Truepera radiovictrix TaxID=332249 RepID=UPI0002E2CD1C|nr:hypothetical protein [Truepera radiovictrix]WMT56223.1 hypothetical protein RCV51_09405 [Truepera radiovictrix]
MSRTTLYRLASEQPERIDLEVAGRVLCGLEQLTGKRYAVSDLLEYEHDVQSAPERLTAAGVPYTGDPETDAVLDEIPDILERVRRHEAGETKMISLKDIAAKYGVKR